MSFYRVWYLAASIMVAVLSLAVPASQSAPARAQAPQVVSVCPEPAAPNGIAVCVDRGEGALYFGGDPITICVTVNVVVIAIFPPPPPPTVRLTSIVDGIARGVIFEQQMGSGQRCITGSIGPPFGQEMIRAELIRQDGTVFAFDIVSYQSAPRTIPPTSVSVTVDRGEGALYLVGDPITVCVNVSPLDRTRPLTVRLVNTVSGTITRTIDLGTIIGMRCATFTVAPPVGLETIRADALDPQTGAVVASDAAGYVSADRPGGIPTPPARFSGAVLVNGQPAPAGTAIQAVVRGSVCGTTSVAVSQGVATYVVDVAAAAAQAGCGTDGDAVTFLVGSARANEIGTFQTGAFVTLNLTVGQAPPPQPPTAPTNLRATVLDASRVQLTWTDNALTEDGFHIYDGMTLVATVVPNTTAFVIGGLPPNSYHCFRVAAFDGSNESPSTDWACVTTAPIVPLPAAPSGLRATVLSASMIRLDWVDTSGNEDGFRIGNGITVIATVAANTTSYIAGGLTPNSWSCFAVQSFNRAGESAWTDWACATTPPEQPPPAPPGNPRATALDANRILVEWVDNSDNEDGFRIGNGVTIVATIGANSTSYVAADLAPDSWTCFAVQAFNQGGDSAWTDWACASTPPLASPAAHDLIDGAVGQR